MRLNLHFVIESGPECVISGALTNPCVLPLSSQDLTLSHPLFLSLLTELVISDM